MTDSSDIASNVGRLLRSPIESVFRELGSGPSGLTTSAAESKLSRYGPNRLPEAKNVPLTHKAAAQFKNLFNVLLLIAAALSFVTGWTSDDIGSIHMGFAILLVVVVSALFSLFQEHRAERAIEALRQLVPDNIKVMRDGKMRQLPSSKIVPGDVIGLEEGDKVPADARLISAFQITVDNSILTGEAEPQPRYDRCMNPEGCTAEDISNLVFAGTTIASGSGTALVLATGTKTRFGQVVGLAHAIEEPLSPLQRELNYTARLNFVAAVGIGLLFLVIALQFLNLQLSESLLFMIGVMVSLVPEGLQVTLTVSLALSSIEMAKRNMVVKRLSAVETLGSTTVICTDKTGTITEGQMTVRRIWTSGLVLDVSGEGYEPDGSVFLEGRELKARDRTDLKLICEVAALDNKSTIVPPLDRRKYRWTAVGDTTDAALLVMAAKAGVDQKRALEEKPRVGMIAFESSRKMMTSIHLGKNGEVTAYVKGAGSEVLARCESMVWGDQVLPLTPARSEEIRNQIDDFARLAYRVIALAVRTLPSTADKYESASVEAHLTFVGLVAILDPPRRDVAQAVAKARSAGIRIVMLTGDHELTADAIARQVGIITSADHIVMSCERLVDRSDEEVSGILDAPEVVLARVTPEQKLRVVRLLKKKGETVAVTGDGVNDAPALLEADIGIAMGITGTDVARESADMVLLDDNFASIVSGVEEGRSVFDNLKKFIAYVFSHNWAELVAFIVFVLLHTPLPLAVVGVLTIDLLLEIPPSISLTMEPPEPGIMDRPPRSRTSRLFDARTLARSFYVGAITGIVAIFWCFSVWSDGGWSLGSATIEDRGVYLKGTTVVLVGIMAGQLGNLFATRTNVKSTFSLSLTRNRWLLPSIAAELAILAAIVYLPMMQPIFTTRALTPLEVLLLFSIAPVILLLEEGRKYIIRAVFLPAPTVAVPAPVPIGAFERPGPYLGRRVPRTAQQQLGPPVIIFGFSRVGTRDALPIGISIAEGSNSKVIISSDRELPRSEKEYLSSEPNVPSEFVGLDLAEETKGVRSAARAMNKYAERVGAEMVVISVRRDVFARRPSKKSLSWLEEFSGRRVVLVSDQIKPERRISRPRRFLVPVLDEFHPEIFALAGALTSSSRVPDVDVVAAKVIRMPQSVPLYSTYRPESLVDSAKELSFLRGISGLPILRRLTPKVVLVRNISRDLVEFAEQRRVDTIILRGDWAASKHGFLERRERIVASKTKCQVVVLLPAAN